MGRTKWGARMQSTNMSGTLAFLNGTAGTLLDVASGAISTAWECQIW